MNMNSGDQSDTMPASAQDIVAFDVRHLSEQQLAALGVAHIAYVKPIMVNGVRGFAIHAAGRRRPGCCRCGGYAA
jgi:hypothetical protein